MTTPAPQRRDLAVELLHRKVNDQMVRRIPTSPADLEAMERVDRDNTAALKRIVAEHGWPGRTLVGEEAAEAAWLLAQVRHEAPFLRVEVKGLHRQPVAAGGRS